MSLDAKLRLARIIVVTGSLGGGDAFASHVCGLLEAGADITQLRDPQVPPSVLREAFEMAQAIALAHNSSVAVTSDVELAKDCDADLLVLPAKSIDPSLAHAKLHPHALVGRSVHDDAGLATAAADHEINFALVGPVYLPAGAPFAAPGLDLVRQAAEHMPVADIRGTPWFATGGIDPATVNEVIEAGARRVSIAVDSSDDAAAVKQLADALRLAWVQDPTLKDFAFGVFGMGSPSHVLRKAPKPSAW